MVLRPQRGVVGAKSRDLWPQVKAVIVWMHMVDFYLWVGMG